VRRHPVRELEGGHADFAALGPQGGASEAWRQRASRLFLEGFLEKGRMRPMLELARRHYACGAASAASAARSASQR